MAEQDVKELNLYQRLAKIRQRVEILKRDTKAYGYSYTKEETILAKVTVFMDKYHLSLIPGIVPGTTSITPYSYKKTKTTQKGDIYDESVNEVLVNADTTWTWVNNDDPSERIVVPWAMVGQQSDASQSFGSGLTYSSRYFLLKYFNISTSNDDPDEFRRKQREAEAEEGKVVARKIIERVDRLVRAYLESNPSKAADVKKLVGKYVKNSDYFAIKEPALAAKLLADIQETLLGQRAELEPETEE